MKRFFIIVISILIFTACGNDEQGVDIGGNKTVSVSFKDTDAMPDDIINTAEGMSVIFNAIVRSMVYYDKPYSDDALFMWQTLTMLLNYCGESTVYDKVVHGTTELVGDYVSACFGGTRAIPELSGGVVHNPESLIYAVPKLNDYVYDDHDVVIGDITDNGDGTFSAYVNLIYNKTGEIGDQYIFTLIKNPNLSIESNYDMIYSVTLVTTLEL